MQHWNNIIIGIIATFILAGCAAQEAPMQNIPESIDTQQPVPEPEPVQQQPVETKEEKVPEPVTEPVVEEKNKFQIFNPVLAYDGAYNGPLYGTSEQIGATSMDSYFENLDRNGINFFIGMFPIFGNPAPDTLVSHQGMGYIIDAAQKHPYRIIPFFNPGIGGEEIEEKGYLKTTWFSWYRDTLAGSQGIAGKDFIKGFGEVETQEWSVRHNDPKIIQLIDLAERNGMSFMFHPVASKISDVEAIIKAYPTTIFLIHMFREDLDKSKTQLIKLLKEHDNLYFSMDAAHIIHVNNMDIIYDYDSPNKQSSISKFVSAYDSKEKSFVNDAIKAYKPLVDAVPDKVMWGTEIGPEYAFDPKVFDRAIKASRLVIAAFDEDAQELVGYKNALRVFGQGVVADPSTKVIDTRDWPYCTDSQVENCDESCAVEGVDEEEETPEGEDCFLKCMIPLKCKEEPHMGIG